MNDITNGRLYGPPLRVPSRPYPPVLEYLEKAGNDKLIQEYKKEISSHMARSESNNDINPAMIDLQPEIQWFMRPFLLDFIVELHSSFRLQSQTLFRCFNIVDRYCAKRIVFKRHYQLVGCTALWIAAKYEDKKSRVPTLRELSMMCRNAYDEEMFVQMERHVLSTLEWSLDRPTLEDCLQLAIEACIDREDATPIRNLKQDSSMSVSSAVTAVSRFLCEMTLYHRDFLEFETSLIAATANALACSMLQIPNAASYLNNLVSQIRSQIPKNIENAENFEPEIFGPFISGFDESSLAKIRKLCLMMSSHLGNITEVLTSKYKPLGVISVLQNFLQRNYQIIERVNGLHEEIFRIDAHQLVDTHMSLIADSLLGLNILFDTGDAVPITPPSSSRSIFSDLYNSSPTFNTPTVIHQAGKSFRMCSNEPSPIFNN